MIQDHPGKPEPGVYLDNPELVPELPSLDKLALWIHKILRQESAELGYVSIAFMQDEDLLQINRQYLNHDTYTDIITFPYNDHPVETEICISVQRVRSNASEFGVDFLEELLRVICHGILHVCGWHDHPEPLAELMRKREDACLVLYGIIPGHYVVSPS